MYTKKSTTTIRLTNQIKIITNTMVKKGSGGGVAVDLNLVSTIQEVADPVFR